MKTKTKSLLLVLVCVALTVALASFIEVNTKNNSSSSMISQETLYDLDLKTKTVSVCVDYILTPMPCYGFVTCETGETYMAWGSRDECLMTYSPGDCDPFSSGPAECKLDTYCQPK